MAVCVWCGKEFDPDFEADDFENAHPLLSYSNVKKCLCADCAIQALDDEVEDVYFETCEKCGKEFDYIEESGKFNSQVDDVYLIDTWRNNILCCDCALEELPDLYPQK